MPTYNKLVRDRIPEIIQDAGKICSLKLLDEETYLVELRKKLQEESEEYAKAGNDEESLEELADMLEIVYALAEIHGAMPEHLEKIRAKKAKERGGYRDRVFLMDVID